MTSVRIIAAATFVLLAGCSSQQLYNVGQGWQKQECLKLPDIAERQRCEKSTALSYERYKAEAEAAKRPKE
jgi:hypothetical protein